MSLFAPRNSAGRVRATDCVMDPHLLCAWLACVAWPWMPSTCSQAIDVGGEQAAACGVPFRVGLPGLSEHRSEGDDIAWSHVLADRAVGTATFDDPLHGAVDLVAHREGFRDGNRQPAMQRQHEFVSLGDRGFDEAPERVAGCCGVAVSRLHVREHLLEGTVGQGVKQVFAGGEVTVERPDADARVCRDRCHGHAGTLTVHSGCRGTHEGLVVAGRVAALLARTRLPHGAHALIEAVSDSRW